MLRIKSSSRRSHGRTDRRRFELNCERLEERKVMSSGTSYPVIGTIAGQITDASAPFSFGVAKVTVQLINSHNKVVATTRTNSEGLYAFPIRFLDQYTVREVVPKGFFQVTPTFYSAGAPSGGYAPGAGNNSWNYGTNTNPANGPVGPAAWSAVAPAAGLPEQSPVNLNVKPIDLRSVLQVNYAPATPTQIINNSHQIQTQFSTAAPTDTITLNGTVYRLSQFHYHDPAENLVNGKAYAMEEHFVNVSASGAETVVGVFLKVGAYNPSLQPLLTTALTSLTKANSTTTGTYPIDFSALLPTSTKGWFYEGSLTTPPLSQPVNWLVYATPITLSRQQLAEYQFVATAGGFLPNARPVQPLTGRILNEIDNYVPFAAGTTYAAANFTLFPKHP
jgi:carbonic anhydrase